MAAGARHKNVVLILAREFATRLATAMFVTDQDGNLVFFNEPAEAVLGRTFAEAGEMPASEWTSLFSVTDVEGRPLELSELPGGVALLERRPSHGKLRVTGLDGAERTLFVIAFPLFAHAEDFVGAVIIFWEEPAEAGG